MWGMKEYRLMDVNKEFRKAHEMLVDFLRSLQIDSEIEREIRKDCINKIDNEILDVEEEIKKSRKRNCEI